MGKRLIAIYSDEYCTLVLLFNDFNTYLLYIYLYFMRKLHAWRLNTPRSRKPI
jgi:hypothetical protein